MNSNDFRVFKDVQNDVEFVVRNTDRKPVNMTGRSAKVILSDSRTNRILHTQDLRVINEAKGICKAVFLPDLFSEWNLQSYTYRVQVTNMDGSTHMLYTDTHESQVGTFELAQGPVFDPRPNLEVSYADLKRQLEEIDGQETTILFSSAFKGSMQRDERFVAHTMQAVLVNFSGTLTIQGSIEPGVPTDEEWFEVKNFTYDHFTGKENFAFEQKLMWVRFRVYNRYDQPEVTPLAGDAGKVESILFRN